MAKVLLPEKDLSLRVLGVVNSDLEKIGNKRLTQGFWALVKELKDDQRKLRILKGAEHPDVGDFFDAQKIVAYSRGRPNRPIWRLKSYDLHRNGLHFRILYAYFEAARMFIVLAVTPRGWDYVHNDPLGQRIAADYDRLVEKFG